MTLLQAQHERLLHLAAEVAEGTVEPMSDLREALRAHVAAATDEIAPLLRSLPTTSAVGAWVADLDRAGSLVADGGDQMLRDVARRLVRVEEGCVLPLLARTLPVRERRSLGSRYRASRDAPHSR